MNNALIERRADLARLEIGAGLEAEFWFIYISWIELQ
jgi:hypothetical protein